MKKHGLLPLILLAFLTVSCGGTLSKNSGFNIAGRGYQNNLESAYVANSFTEVTDYSSKCVFEHYNCVYIKINFTPVVGSYQYVVDNMFDILELDTYVGVSLALYDTNGTEITNLQGNEKIYKGYTVSYYFDYCYGNACSSHCEQTEENTYVSITNANMKIRQSEMSEKRSDDYMNFPIYQDNKGTVNVYNSEELWWAVNNNYLPVIEDTNLRVYDLWNAALKINRQIISDDMDDFHKLLAIYEYIASDIRYNYDAADLGDNWVKDTAFYVEGSLLYGDAVCDSFSKVFNLLAGIENLDTKRGYGYTTTAGHAWNYASIDGTNYYLCCATWGRAEVRLFDNETYVASVNICNYEPFMTKSTFFKDCSSQQNYKEYIFPDINKCNTYLPIFSQDYFTYNNQQYDYVINSDEELKIVFQKCISLGIENKFYVSFQESPTYTITDQKIKSVITSLGYDGFYAIHNSSGYLNQYHKLGYRYFCCCIY